ncbi:DUF4846 domain-containing protein [Clostridium sediminicola]|uniref:DUF4846 domain-containing protein n=1 Tax=Clostridium sediminicola TaxID=3114879 RepID=UPI0031F21AD1
MIKAKKKFIVTIALCVPLILIIAGCSINKSLDNSLSTKNDKENNTIIEKYNKKIDLINPEGKTVEERFNVPEGFKRVSVDRKSFQNYLRDLPLKPHGSVVHYFDGREKDRNNVYIGVVDLDVGDRDLQQCADAVMRLRAEYLYQNKMYDNIQFHFVNGFNCNYSKWKQGYRVAIEGNNTSWVKKYSPDDSYKSFRNYLNVVFAYASTLSLDKELVSVEKEDMKIGDVFIRGGSPGHAVIVVDMAVNEDTGEKLFMLAQSYMPAQEIQILVNNNNEEISPWYSNDFIGELSTPEWRFDEEELKSF